MLAFLSFLFLLLFVSAVLANKRTHYLVVMHVRNTGTKSCKMCQVIPLSRLTSTKITATELI